MMYIIVALFIDSFQAAVTFGLLVLPGIGEMLSFAICVCISLTAGTFLVFLMLFSGGIFYPSYIWSGYVGEVIPGVDILPIWTTMVILCLLKKVGEEKAGTIIGAAAGLAASASPQGMSGRMLRNATTGAALIRTTENAPRAERTPLVNSPRVDGIRPAQKIAGTAAALLLFFSMGVAAHAQSIGSAPTPVQFIVTPEVPGPNQSVSIQIQGVGTFLGEAAITWQLNGKTVKTGTGERSYSFTTGAVGSQSRVYVSINSASQGTIVHDFTFLPSTVNLIWEADTSVPPMYRGKALFSAGSFVTVTAFPQVVAGGSSASAGSLSFQWKRNGTPTPEQSGKGRNTFSFDGDQLKSSEVVSVDVYVGSTRVAQGAIVISAETPVVLFYARDPLRGTLFDATLPSAISLSAKEITVQAQPYFFSNQSVARGSLSYDWKINGQSASGPDAQRGILTLRQTGTGAGQANIGVSVQNTDTDAFIQSAQAALKIVFGTQNNSGLSSFFGL
jgi:hypothetical protein